MSTPAAGPYAPVATPVAPDQTVNPVTLFDLILDYNIDGVDVFAAILFIGGLIAMILGAGVSAVISGLFWIGGLCAAVTGLSSLAVKLCKSETLAMIAYIPIVGSVVGIMISLFSAIVHHSIISRIDACASDTGVFGTETDDHSGIFDANAVSCHEQNPKFDCSCIIESIDDTCFNYDMVKNGGDCGPLVGDRLPGMLNSTAISLWFVFACTILVGVLMCHRGGCLSSEPRSRAGSITHVEGVAMTQVPDSVAVATASRTNSRTSASGDATEPSAAEDAKQHFVTVSAAVVQEDGEGYAETGPPEPAAAVAPSGAESRAGGVAVVSRGSSSLPVVTAHAVSIDINV